MKIFFLSCCLLARKEWKGGGVRTHGKDDFTRSNGPIVLHNKHQEMGDVGGSIDSQGSATDGFGVLEVKLDDHFVEMLARNAHTNRLNQVKYLSVDEEAIVESKYEGKLSIVYLNKSYVHTHQLLAREEWSNVICDTTNKYFIHLLLVCVMPMNSTKSKYWGAPQYVCTHAMQTKFAEPYFRRRDLTCSLVEQSF